MSLTRVAESFFVVEIIDRFITHYLMDIITCVKSPKEWGNGHLKTALQKLLSSKASKNKPARAVRKQIIDYMKKENMNKQEFIWNVLVVNKKCRTFVYLYRVQIEDDSTRATDILSIIPNWDDEEKAVMKILNKSVPNEL